MLTNRTITTSGLKSAGSATKDTDGSVSSHLEEGRFGDDGDDEFSADEPSSSKDDSSNTSPSSRLSSTNGTSTNGNGVFQTNREDRNITGAKCVFLTLLMGAAAGLGTIIYFSTLNEEEGNFQNNFENDANQVLSASNENLKRVFETMETLSKTTTTFNEEEHAHHLEHNETYPYGFVTIPDAEIHLAAARKDTGAYILAYTPNVEEDTYELWAEYVEENIGWLRESWESYSPIGIDDKPFSSVSLGTLNSLDDVEPRIWSVEVLDENGEEIVLDSESCYDNVTAIEASWVVKIEKPEDAPFAPIWTMSPPPQPFQKGGNQINYDMLKSHIYEVTVANVDTYQESSFHDICKLTAFFDPQSHEDTLETIVVTPVFESHEEDAEIVGHYFSVVPWYVFFKDELPGGSAPVLAVIESSCGNVFTFEIRGREAILLSGKCREGFFLSIPTLETNSHLRIPHCFLVSDHEDVHDPRYDNVHIDGDFGTFAHDTCIYNVTIYPTDEYAVQFYSNNPVTYMLVVVAIFVMTTIAFLLFDYLVIRRQRAIVTTAKKQNALVSSLFPKSIQKKLMEDMEEGEKGEKAKAKWNKSGTAGLRSYLNDDVINNKGEETHGTGTKPIADLFPETTIMFADISGFTAWSSTREPSQVFTLLESIYAEFDAIAKRRRVFKVEVVGDCYVAVAGLPDPRPDHANVMAKFSNDCLKKMEEVMHRLEVELGPDTAELSLRVGLHSGPVVAGVLRGDKSRFQLFGDTMNTASRMESNGVPGRIHLSQETASQLIASGKERWVVAREEKISAKGKGELSTYFLNIPDRSKGNPSDDKSFGSLSRSDRSEGSNLLDDETDAAALEEKHMRVAEWTVEVMSQQLKTLVASRRARRTKADSPEKMAQLEALSNSSDKPDVIKEVANFIILPEHEMKASNSNESLNQQVVEELRNYVQTIASLYNENPFHSFDHANHVVMSVNKLLSRINAPDLDSDEDGKTLHDHTYGITSDPLTSFACVFSALIHDADHSGVPNAQLVKECTPVASLYKGRSVAEQNSFDIAWDLLMEPSYSNLRNCIYTTEGEFKRFRQLVINSVMATDIVDKDLKKIRNDRWDAAFDESKMECLDCRRTKVLKATIVIEHLIQASDVAHTMQHWHIYRRWNERFFNECYQAYLDGRAETNPADGWYKGEMGFFDFYIIPLAKKLKDCGVFGVSSDEYLSYATQNRKEWEERGEEMVKEMVSKARRRDLAAQKRALERNVV
ncbi:MAG: hypothetical protein SGILL_004297 [Bacillariaceae sp.]